MRRNSLTVTHIAHQCVGERRQLWVVTDVLQVTRVRLADDASQLAPVVDARRAHADGQQREALCPGCHRRGERAGAVVRLTVAEH